MRAYVALLLALTAAATVACGDNAAGPTDARPPDARPPDARIDAMIDAPPPPPVLSRVWAVGDIMVDNQPIAAAYTDGTGTLPYGAGAAPPISLAKVQAFDAVGSKTAFVSDLTLADRFDLNVAGADGSSPIAVVIGGVANVEISSVALSPDGTKVAFTMDSTAINNGFDLYVASTTAAATPVKVSPDRPAGAPAPADQDVFSVYTWSSDSKYLAFSADLTENGVDQAYVVDTTAATPAAVELFTRAEVTVTTGTRGVRGALLFDNMNNVYFRARGVAGSTLFQLFKAAPAGTARSALTLPPRGDATTPEAGPFAITPDGTKIVFAADAPTLATYDLYIATLASPVPAKITALTAPGNPSFFSAMVVSPDATRVAFAANFLSARFEPFVVSLDGTTQTPRRLVSVLGTCAGCATPDADAVQWTANSAALFVRGDLLTNNDTRVFRVSPAMADQAPTLAVTTPANGDVTALVVRRIP
jgi:hypothetical protein